MSGDLQKSSLQPNTSDYVTTAAKAALGAVPFAGSLLAELAGTIIPNQRVDRIVKFAHVLERKLSALEEEFVRSQFRNENFTDLLEEALRQSARSLTDERRDYIAAVIANSLTSEEIEYNESKHLLRILNDINDIEVIWLKAAAHPFMNEQDEFAEKHQDVFTPINAYMGSQQKQTDKKALQKSYKEHLTQLGLLEHRYKIDSRTKALQYDSHGFLQIEGYRITILGKLLLRQIGLEVE